MENNRVVKTINKAKRIIVEEIYTLMQKIDEIEINKKEEFHTLSNEANSINEQIAPEKIEESIFYRIEQEVKGFSA